MLCLLGCVLVGLVCFRGSGVCGRGGKEGEWCPMWPDVCDEGLACFNDREVRSTAQMLENEQRKTRRWPIDGDLYDMTGAKASAFLHVCRLR
jgi:hypothetical protein